jgi:hypothetical protein
VSSETRNPVLNGNEKQCVVSSSIPRRAVRNGEESLDFGAVQETDKLASVALAGYRQDTLNVSSVRWRLVSGVVKEGPNGRQAQVASTRFVRPIFFQALQEVGNEGCIEIRKRKSARLLPQSLLSKDEQKAEDISVGSDRVWAGLPLVH